MIQKREVQRFPKEFKKKFLRSFDWRFYAIVALSSIITIIFVLFFRSRLPGFIQPKEISQIQQQYANIVLDRDQGFPPPAIPRPTESDITLPGMGVATSEVPSEAAEGISVSEGRGTGRRTAESSLPTVGEIAQGRRGGTGRGGRVSAAEVASEVGNVGFLGILTSGSGYVPEGYINAITNYGDAENSRLGDVLSQLDAVRVSRGPEGRGWGAGREGEAGDPTGGRVLRGTRRDTRALSTDDLIGTLQPQGELAFQGVEKNQKYEALSSSLGKKPAVPTTPEEKELLRRKPEKVQAIINKHRLVIIDCYKRLLRRNPHLKGKVQVRFAIDSDGKVTWAEIVSSTFEEESLHSCILSRIRRWNDFGYGDPTAPDEVYRQVFTFGY